MKHTITLLAVLILAGEAKSAAMPDSISFIDNGQIKGGVNQDLGGAITWLEAANKKLEPIFWQIGPDTVITATMVCKEKVSVRRGEGLSERL